MYYNIFVGFSTVRLLKIKSNYRAGYFQVALCKVNAITEYIVVWTYVYRNTVSHKKKNGIRFNKDKKKIRYFDIKGEYYDPSFGGYSMRILNYSKALMRI